jgi:hypothetical protein
MELRQDNADAEGKARIAIVGRGPDDRGTSLRLLAPPLWYLLLVILVSSHFAIAYLTDTNQYVNLRDYADGNATLPFQYRALTSWILALLSHTPVVQAISSVLPAPFSDPIELALLLVVGISMAGTLEISRRSIFAVTSDANLAAAAAFLSAAAAYISYVSIASSYRFSYPYDIPSLMLFSLGYYFILKSNVAGFCVAFLLAALSRETSIFLLVAFLCQRWTTTTPTLRRDATIVLALAGAFVAIKLFLFALYGENLKETVLGHAPVATSGIPGAMFVFQLGQNLDNLSSPLYWPSTLSACGWLWLPVAAGWRLLDQDGIKRTLLVIAPLWFLAMLMTARITEVRVFGELILPFVVATSIIARNGLTRFRNPPMH